jgi:hypothetical protein
VPWPIIRQIYRLLPATLGQLKQGSDMAVVQLAGELQVPVDEHADALAEEFFGADRRTELT